MWQEHSDPERFADWPQRLSQRGIGQVEGIHEGEPWLHFGDQLFFGRYSRGVGKQQALVRSKSRANLQRRFGIAIRTNWHGSIADQFLPAALHWNENGGSKRFRDCVGSHHRGRSIGLQFLSSFRKWAYSILLSTPMRSR